MAKTTKSKIHVAETFANKLSDLEGEHLQYTEDFFAQAFPVDTHNTATSHNIPAEATFAQHQVESALDEQWLASDEQYHGQLAIDVFEDGDKIILVTAVAGVSADDLELALDGDMITIKGTRRHRYANIPNENYFINECFWGGFSRSIILPVDIAHERIEAKLEAGVLTVVIPKATRPRNTKIAVEEID